MGGGGRMGGGGGHHEAPHAAVVHHEAPRVVERPHVAIVGGIAHRPEIIVKGGGGFHGREVFRPHYVGVYGGAWHHSYCPPGGIRYALYGGGFYYAPHHYSWGRWGGGWGWGCYGWWGGRYMPYRWGLHPYYGWGYWPWDVAVSSFILGAAVGASMAPTTTTTTTTTVITGTAVQSGTVMTGTPVNTGSATGSPTYQIPPPGFGFPVQNYDGKSDPPQPPSPDTTTATSPTSKTDDSKSDVMTAPPEKLPDPSKIDFDYSKPPSEIPYFANQMKTTTSTSDGPVG